MRKGVVKKGWHGGGSIVPLQMLTMRTYVPNDGTFPPFCKRGDVFCLHGRNDKSICRFTFHVWIPLQQARAFSTYLCVMCVCRMVKPTRFVLPDIHTPFTFKWRYQMGQKKTFGVAS